MFGACSYQCLKQCESANWHFQQGEGLFSQYCNNYREILLTPLMARARGQQRPGSQEAAQLGELLVRV